MASPSGPQSSVQALANELSTLRILESTKKGRLKYENGWDKLPHSFYKLVSEVQQQTEIPKARILERAYQITIRDKQRKQQQLQDDSEFSPDNEDQSSCCSSAVNEFYNSDYYESSASSSQNNSPVHHALTIATDRTGRRVRFTDFPDDLDEDEDMQSPPKPLTRLSRHLITSVKTQSPVHSFSVKFDPHQRNVTSSTLSPTGKSARKVRYRVIEDDDEEEEEDDEDQVEARLFKKGQEEQQVKGSKSSPTNKEVLNDSKDLLGHILVRGYGIREEEYDDEQDAIAFLNDSFVYLSADQALLACDEEYKRKAEERICRRNKMYTENKKKTEESLKQKEIEEKRRIEMKRLQKEEKILKSREEGKKQIADYLSRRRIDKEKDDLIRAEMESERRRLIEQCKKHEEEEAARALAELKKLETEKLALAQLKEAAEKQQKLQQEAAEAASKLLAATATTTASESTPAVAPSPTTSTLQTVGKKGFDVPPEFQNAVLPSDLQKYLKSQQLLSDYKEKFAHLSSRECKEYYFAALKAVNTPLNALAPDSIQEKLTQFVHLLEGRQVSVGESTVVNFCARSQPEGEHFVSNLFAFRFVKKSESEISKGHDNVAPLARLGVQLAKQFPSWAIFVRANFFKMCPFLVPFSFPQNNMSSEEYAKAIGHDLHGSDNSVRQALLDKMTGYVMLYCLMVKFMDEQKGGRANMGEIAEFFSIKEVWRILVATMKLKPQVDITATVVRIILETLGNRLSMVYKGQFQKLVQVIVTSFLLIIRGETPQGRQAAVTRLELLLEAKLQKGF